MFDEIRTAVETHPDVLYALVFGSGARGTLHDGSDVDVAIELRAAAPRDPHDLRRLIRVLETAVRRPVDLILLDEAPPSIAYRVFRDGILVLERDHAALTARKARAIVEYLDFQPVEELCAAGVLRAARGR